MTVDTSFALSPIQQGMLYHYFLDQHAGVDIEQMVIESEVPLDRSALQCAWQNVVDRHEILRTSFVWEALAQPVQQVHASVPISIEKPDQDIEAYLQSDRRRGFDPSEVPLMRFALFASDGKWRLVWSFHHILMDGRAFVIVLRELFQFYDAVQGGKALVLPEPRPFRDYIEWLAARDDSGAREFWNARLQGFTAPTPLPLDRLVAASADDSYGEEELRLSLNLSDRLRDFARREGLTMNTLIQGAWALLLSRYSGEEDVVFGATKTTRRSSVPDADSIVGLFLATIPVRISVAPDRPVREWLKDLRAEWVSLRLFEHTPLVQICGASDMAPGAPLFETLVVYENQRFDTAVRAEIGASPYIEFQLREQTNYALTLAAYGDVEVLLKLEYDGRRFGRAFAGRLLGHLEILLEGMSSAPDHPLRAVPLVTSAERQQLLFEWNHTDVTYAPELCLHQVFEAQLRRTPENVALVFENAHLTYRELNARANQLAHHLQRRGVGPDTIVALFTERSLEMVVGLLGILKAGGAYLPIDTAYPRDRVAFMLEDAQPRVLLTQHRLLPLLPESSIEAICLDSEWSSIARESTETPSCGASPEDLAYVIYTSGSTGQPKGVLIPQRALLNLLWSMREWLQLNETDRVLAVATISFDIAGVDVWLPLLAGAQSVIAKREEAANGAAVRDLLTRHDITFLQATPVTWRMLFEAGWAGKPNLQAVCTGEAMPPAIAGRLTGAVKRLWNLYGPTETTIWSTGYQVRDGRGPILIGRPVANTQCYILDAQGQPVPVGVTGELYIGGEGVARGYLNRPELTAEKFLPDPFRGGGARMYRTGDLARYEADGNIECLGRIDHQVKIRGFRIELGEIEAALKEQPEIKEAVVVAREDTPGDKRLAAYLVAADGTVPDAAGLRAWLKQRLPDYMIPAVFVPLAALPITGNGKFDRRALPAPEYRRAATDTGYAPPRNVVEEKLVEIWEKVLGVPKVGIHDNFFDLGGDSLLAVQLFTLIETSLHVRLPLNVLFDTTTIAELAAQIRVPDKSVVSPRHSAIPIQREGIEHPVFWVPGGRAISALSYRPVVLRLGPNQPSYTFESRLPAPGEAFETTEERAAAYIECMQAVQPEGPYVICGFCFGGLIAYEMAQQLLHKGEAVATLALIDSAFPNPGLSRSQRAAVLFQRALCRARSMGGSVVVRLPVLIIQNIWRELRSRLLRAILAYARNTGMRVVEEEDTLVANARALSAYRPQPYPGRVLACFSAQSDYAGVDPMLDPRRMWSLMAPNARTIEIAGDHFSLLEEPEVETLARCLRAELTDARNACQASAVWPG